jgi:4a-hydroxytetrahydrobiopterin dehydratase
MKLSEQQIAGHLANLPGWQFQDNTISKTFKFANFKDAFAFMTTVAAEAERMHHHPDWSNVYNTVTVRLTTHDEGGLSELDFKLASFMDIASANANIDEQ